MSKEKIFCFPYAGGSSTLYEGNFSGLKEVFDVIPLDYSGHGTKFGLPLHETMEALIEEAYQETKEKLSKDESYCLLGYSMGSVVAYEIACRLRTEGYRTPKRMFLFSMQAPRRIPEEEWLHQLSQDDFLKEIVSMGGIDEELLADPLMMKVFFPIIRMDFRIFELYDGVRHEMLDTDALILYSEEDIRTERIHGWDEVIARTEYLCYPGGHFFVYEHCDEAVGEILKRR